MDSVFVNDRVLFELTLTGQGYAGLTVPVTLREKGKDAVLAKKVNHAAGRQRGCEGAAGVQADGDRAKRRTSLRRRCSPTRRTRKTIVMERQVLSARPSSSRCCTSRAIRRYEYHFLKTLLERESDRTKGNKSIDLKVVLLNADPDYAAQDRTALAEIPTKEELNAYDVIILGDVDPRPKDNDHMTEHLKDIAEWVTDHGGGLLMIAGERYAPFYYKDSPLKRRVADRRGGRPSAGRAADVDYDARATSRTSRRRDCGIRSSASVPRRAADEEIWKDLKKCIGGRTATGAEAGGRGAGVPSDGASARG